MIGPTVVYADYMYFEKSTVNLQNGQKIAWYRVDISNDELRRLRAH